MPVLMVFLSACGSGSQKASEQKGDKKDQEADKDQQEQVVNVYSHRHYEVDEKLYNQFEEETDIKVNVVNAGADELMKKLEMEGKSSPADLLISVDAGRLYRAREKDLLQPVDHETLKNRVPSMFRDPDNYWYGLTYRARAIAYHNDRVEKGAIETYEGLADDQWQDRVLIRSSQNVYNQSLIASILAHNGEEATKKWLNGLVNNFARKPQGGDSDQIKAVAGDEGDVAVINTYYLFKMLQSENEAERDAAEQVNLVFPNQDGRGAHVNVSGAGITKHAPNKDNALKLLKFLTSQKAQEAYAAENYEYPVVKDVNLPKALEKRSDFKKDSLNLNKLGQMNRKAVKMADEAGWR